jgi:hypothetical protein
MIGRVFVELADTLVDGYDVIDFLQGLTRHCVALLDVAEVGVALEDSSGILWPIASSSERMRALELIEIQREDGPCLDCWRTGEAVRADDLESAHVRWPRFVPAALQAGFRSVYALPLRLRTDRIGALNLFAERSIGLSEDDAALGQALADVATIGILHERSLRERSVVNEQLRAALDSRIAIEQAKGMVAEQSGIDVDTAFALIRRHARDRNAKLTDVAVAIIKRQLTAASLDTTRRSPSQPGSRSAPSPG